MAVDWQAVRDGDIIVMKGHNSYQGDYQCSLGRRKSEAPRVVGYEGNGRDNSGGISSGRGGE